MNKTWTLPIAALLSLAPFSALAHPTPLETNLQDPREQPGFSVLFDFEALSDADIANGYGGYIQHYRPSPTEEVFRFCDNFEGSGLSGRPNLSLKRDVFVPIGTHASPVSYDCIEFDTATLERGRPMIELGNKYFFLLRAEEWRKNEGGTLLFQVARRVPTIGSPSYKVIRLRVSPMGPGGVFRSEMLVPRGETLPATWFRFTVTSSMLGLPNRIREFILNPGSRFSRVFNIDELEDPAR
jgi:hypothetical protein